MRILYLICQDIYLFIERPYDVRLWQAQGICYEEIRRYGDFVHINVCFIYIYIILRYREAIECLKRALIPADPREITINFKLAKLHQLLDEPAEAIAYHRRVVEVCQTDS